MKRRSLELELQDAETGVKLCGDDRLCRECDCKNERELHAMRSATRREKAVSSRSSATAAAESGSDPPNMELSDEMKQPKQPKKPKDKKIKSVNTTAVQVDNEHREFACEQDSAGNSCP